MAQANRSPDDPQTGAPEFAGQADAATLDEPPKSNGARPEPVLARLVERTSAIIAERQGEPQYWSIGPAAAGENLPVAGETGDQPPAPAPASAAPVEQLSPQRGATERMSPIARLAAIVAVAGIGVLLLHPAAQKVAPGNPPVGEAAVGTPATTSPTSSVVATPGTRR